MRRSVRIPVAISRGSDCSCAWSQPANPARVNTPIHEAHVPTSVRLDPSIEARLDQLAEATGRSKAYYLRELIEQGIDDLEDSYLGAAVLERIRAGKEQTYSLNDVMEDLGLDASDL